MKILVTGGAGFIGSAVIRQVINHTDYSIVNIDKLTYAGNLESLHSIDENERYSFVEIDICDGKAIRSVFQKHQPDVIMHLAAESHVDRSIDGPSEFIQTNIVGTFSLLEEARTYWKGLKGNKRDKFRFHHISTDEVYGDLVEGDGLFTETSSYSPSSPYSASKAASDHLVRAWYRTYGLPIVITNCSNNYGPYQFPEKLIPLVISSALQGKKIPIYGNGEQVRDWLYVEDHARALLKVAAKAKVGETYNIGGNNEKPNIDVVHKICELLEELLPDSEYSLQSGFEGGFKSLIEYVTDRPGHDVRYAIDAQKIKKELGWEPQETFDSGIRKTVEWYLSNQKWWQNVLDGSYQSAPIGEK